MDITSILERLQGVKKTSTGWQARCPGHDDHSPSLTISEGGDGRTLLKCFAGCTPEAICSAIGVKLSDLFADNGHSNGNGSPSKIVAKYDYTGPDGKLLFQVCRYEPKTFKQRRPDATSLDGWTWNTRGVQKVLFRLPEILKAVQSGKPILIAEGEKDVLKLVEKGFDATCNPGGAGKWLDSFSETLRGAEVVIVADKDEAGRKHAELVASKLHGVAKSIRVLELPGENIKDAHDFFTAGGDAAGLIELVDSCPEWKPSSDDSLTIRTPDEILSMQFDDRDMILGDRLLAKGQPLVIAGQGGLGKSRLLLQFIVTCRANLPFIGFDTRGQEMTWLVLQGENSNRRLQNDLASFRAWVGEKYWPQVNAGIHIHTLETDADNFLSLDDQRTQARIREIIARTKPDGIAWDSLYNFGIGNLSSDEDMTGTLLAIARLSKAGNPDRAIVVLHHALTGKAGASRATGYERSSFARNSKVLHQWTRGQINVAPGQPDSNDMLVMSCGKCSNGKEFAPFAVRLDPETMIYKVDEAFDLTAWQNEVTGKRTEADLSPTRIAEIVAELCKAGGPPKKPQLVKALKEETGCGTSGAYKAIERAERAKAIHYARGTKTYVVR